MTIPHLRFLRNQFFIKCMKPQEKSELLKYIATIQKLNKMIQHLKISKYWGLK